MVASPSATIVVGLQFGDEGKGQIVDLLAAEHEVIVRYNGGANAGHTVRVGGERFALHLLPSGVVTPGTINVIAHGVALDPFVLLDEMDGLAGRGIGLAGRLWISDRAHLVLPWHRAEEALLERALPALGTTGRGIGPCYADKARRATALRAVDLLDPALPAKVAAIARVKQLQLAGLAAAMGQEPPAVDAASLAESLRAAGERLRPYLTDTVAALHEALATRRVLFEGAHATMLDLDLGTFPYVTSSSATALGVHAGAGVPARAIGRVVGVLKAYTSRVGAGPFPTELHGPAADRLRERGDEYGTTTRRPRRVGWLDLPMVRFAAQVNGVTELAVTGLGVLAGLDELAVGISYRLGGESLVRLPASAEQAAMVQAVTEPVKPWPSLDGGTTWADLPGAARSFVERIERDVAPVRWLCLGPGREEVVRR